MPLGVETIARGGLARLLYRLGRNEATGILTLTDARGHAEVLVLRRGSLCADDARAGLARLARLAAAGALEARWDGGVHAHPPVPASRTVPLAAWARRHLEAQLDASRADALTRELAAVRVALRSSLAPPAAMLDEADRRILAALDRPRRLDQLWSQARTPRFRLLGFLYFLRQVGALDEVGVGAFDSGPHRAPIDPRRQAAAMVLGVSATDDRHAIKRAYRELARGLHPDLQPGLAPAERRALEGRLADVTAAAATLLG
ncbi:MAG: hypothetical protein R3B06_21070 [Kofleriaceae bacterium]